MIEGWILDDGELEARGRAEGETRRLRWSAGLLVDPSAAVLRRAALGSREGMRGIAHGGSHFWWDAWIATHAEGLRLLGVFDRTGAGQMEVNLHGGVAFLMARDPTFGWLRTHPSLAGRVDEDGRLR
jgi:hypothetical protein